MEYNADAAVVDGKDRPPYGDRLFSKKEEYHDGCRTTEYDGAAAQCCAAHDDANDWRHESLNY